MKVVLAILGIISLILGIIGIFLPLLPTVPFVLLSAYLFTKSSIRLHSWLINHNLFGFYISSYNHDKSIPMKAKILSITMLWISTLVSIFLIFKNMMWMQLLLSSIAVGVTSFIIRMKTKNIVK